MPASGAPGTTPTDDRLERIVRLARAALGVPFAGLVSVAGEGIRLVTSSGRAPADLAGALDGLRDRIIRAADVVALGRGESDADRPGTKLRAAAPLRARGGSLQGALVIGDARSRRVSAAERRTLIDLAALAMDALDDSRPAEVPAVENATLLRAVMDAIPGVVNVKDRAGRYVHVNSFQAAYYGTTPEALSGTRGEALPAIPDYDASLAATEAKVWRTGQGTGFYEEPYCPPGGEPSVWWTTKVPVCGPDGSVTHLLGLGFDITQRKAMERELAASEARYRDIVESQSELVAHTDRDGTLMFVNQAFARFFGGAPKDFVGRAYVDLVAPELRARVKEHLADIGRDRKVGTSEERVLRADDTTGWLHWTDRAVLDEQGHLSHLVSVGRDVTERKQAEDAVRESEARLKSLADTAPVILWMNDAEDRHLFQNQAWLDFYGVDPGKPVGTPWVGCLHPDDEPVIGAIYRYARAREAPFQGEYRMRRFDGAWRWLKEVGTPRFAADGSLAGYTGACLDITDKKVVEDALRESENRLKSLADTAPVLLWLNDAHGELQLVNAAYREFFGLADDASPGDIWFDNVHPAERDAYRADYEDYLANWVAYQRELRLRRADGSHRWILEIGAPRFDADGVFFGYAGAGLDITDLKETESALRLSERRFQDFAASASDWLWETDQEHRFVMHTGVPTGWLDSTYMGRARWEMPFVDPHDPKWQEHKANLAARGPVRDFEYAFRDPQGMTRYIRINGVPVFDDDGAFRGYRGTGRDVTEQIMAEERLRENRERLELALAGADLGMWDLDVATERETSDTRWYATLGYAPDETPRSPADFRALIHEDDLAHVREAFARHLEGGTERYESEFRLRAKDRTWRWALARGRVVLRDGVGRPLRVTGTILDVTDRREAQEELSRHRELLRQVIDAVPANIALRDREGRYVVVNEAVARWIGAKAEVVIGRTPHDFYEKGIARALLERDRHAFETGAPTDPFEDEFPDVDGSPRVWLSRRVPIRDADVSDPYVLAVGFDITDLKHAEAEVRRSREFLRFVLDSVPFGVSVRDREGRFTFMNATDAAWLGVDVASVVGKVSADIPYLDDDASRRHREAIENGRTVGPYIESFRAADGVVHKWLVTRSPGRGPSGAIDHVITVAIDVTEQQELEDRLRQSEKLRAIGQLTGGIAHDFNNLLAIVVGNLDLAVQSLGKCETRQLLETAVGAAVRGGELAHRLLAFARQQPLTPMLAGVNGLLRGMMDLLDRSLGNGIDIQMRLAARLPAVRVDTTQFETTILNLAINARDAMPKGGCLTLGTRAVPVAEDDPRVGAGLEPRTYVEVTVADTGIGIPAEDLARVFEPFFTTKSVGKGTGLGLSMVYGFARQSGGEVSVTSTVGQGTTIRLLLPEARPGPGDDPPVEDADQSRRARTASACASNPS